MALKKIILIICDGMSDRRIASLNNKTPLEYAKTPNFNKIAEYGITGVLDVLEPGYPPGSDAGHLAIFGYDLAKYYPNRGPIEAIGANIDIKKGSIAFRLNLATVKKISEKGEDYLIIKDRRAGRIESNQAKEMIDFLQENIKEIDGVKIKIIHNSEHRGILILEGKNLSGDITDNDPHEINICVNKSEPLVKTLNLANAERTSKIINQVVKQSYLLLKDHPLNNKRKDAHLLPANILLPRGAGVITKIEPFSSIWGLNAACIAKLDLYKGVARFMGMDIYDVEGATGDIHTNVEAKFMKAIELVDKYDFIFIHIKGPDSASHDKKPLDKVKIIEKIDSALKIILENIIETGKGVVAITSDHSSSSELGMHIGDPPALVITAPNIVTDDVTEFNEGSVLKGGLGRINSRDLIRILLGYSLRALEYGLKPTKYQRIYRSEECNRLKL